MRRCRGEEAGNITYSLEGETNDNGVQLAVEGDHGEELCEVTLVKSRRTDCDEIPDEGWAEKPSSKVTLTVNSGFYDETRHANPLGFTKKEPCRRVQSFSRSSIWARTLDRVSPIFL
ncbi:hypothetical protein Pfo_012820 [Paulownia fortunei]|nr:hypothetical protein Pfo_012820 [Paulownia fortunei]